MIQVEEYVETLFSNYPNCHYLQKRQIDIPNTNYSILGCTLWTNVPVNKYLDCLTHLNDVNYISIDGIKRFSPEYNNILHKDHCYWLTLKLDYLKCLGRKAIVLTHHLPTHLLINEKYINDPLNYLFYTELSDNLQSEALQSWICGHSHANKRILYRKNVELMMNCKGYSGEKITDFNPSCIYEIKENGNQGKEGETETEAVEFI